MNVEELRQIFEYELKRKLAQRSRSPQEELRKLISSFKFFDYTSSFILDKNQWIKGVLKTGLCGFNINDLAIVFERYDPNKTGYINYINFSNHIYGKEELIPIASNFENNNNQNNINNNINNNANNNIVNNKANISEFKPPGLYERNFDNTVKQNQLSHYNNSESLLNDFDLNNNNNINSNNKNIPNNINNNIIEDNKISQQKNYHMSKSQSQIITPNRNNNINNLKNDTNNSNNNNNINIEDIPPNNNNIKDTNNNSDNKSYFQKMVNLFRNQININNGITYYTFAHGLKSLEDKSTNTISIENLFSVIDQMGLNISQDDLINFYSVLDYTQSNKVPIDEILRLIKGEMPEQRKILVVSKFGIMDKEKTGIIPISLVKELFNFKFHPDAFLGKKTSEEVYKEFLYTFNIFCELKGLKDEISYKDFIDYYTPISASILNDNYFDDIIYGAWNIEDNNIIDKYNINNGNNNNLNIKENNNINEGNIQIEKRNNFEINNSNSNSNNLSKSQNISNINQMRVFSPNRNEENIKKQRMSPYYNPRITPEGKGLKMFRQLRFNPITNEYIMSPITPERNINPINNQNYNIDNNNLYTNINANTNINSNNNINNNYLNDNGNKKISLLRDLLAKRGQKSIFIIQRMFYIYDRNQTGQIPFDKLCDIFEIYNINLTREDIFEFFNILDKEHKGIINYNDLIQILIDNFNQNREIIIQKLFEKYNKGKGFVSINDLKQNFNPVNHPDVINQLRNKDEIFLDFIDSLEIFREYNGNLNNENIKNGYMSYDDFKNFFKEISMSIPDDKYFEYLVNNCWSLNQNNIEKNNYNYNNNNVNYGNDNVRIRTGKEIVNNF